MIRQGMTIRLAILFLLLGTNMAWSQRQHKQKDAPVAQGSVVPAESKLSPRFSDGHRRSHGYILEEDDRDHSAGPQAEEYVDSEDHKSHKEQDEEVGNEESDKTVKDDEYDDHAEKAGHQKFVAGGASFDKHLKDHKADNKEIDNVKQHDIGEKFGGEARKEHKLGKNKEKSKGHKLHGFKNVYHKEEYGDHKTFHDEFLDSDHQHNYDDHHEHQEMQGGKFSKGFKHEGKNKKYDKGDEKREWGKEDYDAHHEGKREKGGQSSKHRHGSKKHQGHYDANVQRNKNAVHKIKKGNPPTYVHHAGHHGPHQAQIQPYVSHYNSHHEQVPSHHHSSQQNHEHAPSHHHSSQQNHEQTHHTQYDDDDKESNNGNYQNHESHHSGHGSHAHDHGGHNNHDHSQHYSQDSSDSDRDYQERTPLNHRHKSLVKEQLDDKSDEKITHRHEPITHKHEPYTHKHEPITHKHEPIAHRQEPIAYKHEPIPDKQPISSHFGTQQYRQPLYHESSLFKQPDSIKQEKFSLPFNERSHELNHKIRYGYQPRSHHHSHHQHSLHHQHPHQHHHHHQYHHQQQPFPRFPGFSSHHYGHDHSHHGAHKKHFRPLSSHYQQESTPETHVQKPEHSIVKPTNEAHPIYSQKLSK